MATFLLLGSTGNLGTHFVDAILSQGHKLKLLVRHKSNSSSERTTQLESYKIKGAEIINGDVDNLESVKHALEGVDVCCKNISKKHKLKRFIPSEFGLYVPGVPEDTKAFFGQKLEIEHLIQQSGLPYTFIYNGLFMEWLWNVSGSTIVEDGNGRGATTALDDITNITVKAALDDRLVNKSVAIIGQELTQNELIQIYETVNGKSDKSRGHVTREALTKSFQEGLAKGDFGAAFGPALSRILWADGATLTSMKKNALLATDLYPDYKLTSVETFYKKFKQ